MIGLYNQGESVGQDVALDGLAPEGVEQMEIVEREVRAGMEKIGG